MAKPHPYVSRRSNSSGLIRYSEQENAIWAELMARQQEAIRGKACDEFTQGLQRLRLPQDRVPQLSEVSDRLRRETGWEVAAVPALIPFSEFFALLADCKFPAATFVRRREDLHYLPEPDIFHEIFGHTPLLTDRYFAAFTQAYGKLGLAASCDDRAFLARLYWFTVEFGLMQKPGASLRVYGGGILSSIGETEHACHGRQALRRPFDIVEVLRTPYRIDIMQPLYYVIEDLRQLFEIMQGDVVGLVAQARRMGLHPPLFPPAAETREIKTPTKQKAA